MFCLTSIDTLTQFNIHDHLLLPGVTVMLSPSTDVCPRNGQAGWGLAVELEN